MLQNCLFCALAARSGFGAAVSEAVARSSIVFCNSVAADRIVVAASRLLRAAAACVILLLSFAAEHRKSYWSGCIQAAIAICQHIFFILAIVIFLVKFLLKSASKSYFFCFGVEIWFWSCSFRGRCTYFYCVLQLSRCRSHWNACVKVCLVTVVLGSSLCKLCSTQ